MGLCSVHYNQKLRTPYGAVCVCAAVYGTETKIKRWMETIIAVLLHCVVVVDHFQCDAQTESDLIRPIRSLSV